MTASRRNIGDEFTPKSALGKIIKEIRRQTREVGAGSVIWTWAFSKTMNWRSNWKQLLHDPLKGHCRKKRKNLYPTKAVIQEPYPD